jgi:hypothetical protein
MTATKASDTPRVKGNPQCSIPTLRATAAMLLPGMRHARSLLDVSIRVLEYFERHAAVDAAAGKLSAPQEAEPRLVAEAEQVKALLSAFGRLNGKNH